MISAKISPFLALSALLLIAPASQADIAPPEEECPPGAARALCEEPYCALPRDCTATSCTTGEQCVTRRVCVGTVDCPGDPGAGQDPAAPMSETFERLCAANEANPCCEERALCLTASEAEETAQPIAAPGGCAVSRAARPTLPLAMLALLSGGMLVALSRRPWR